MRRVVEKGIVTMGVLFVFGTGVAWAQHGHGAGTAAPSGSAGMMSHTMSMAARPVQSATVDGLKLSVDVMGMEMHAPMQKMKGSPLPDTFDQTKSMAIMVMIESAQPPKTVKDADVAVTVVSPAGKTESEKAHWYGDHYGVSFEPEEVGTYRILVTAVSNGIKREAEFTHVE